MRNGAVEDASTIAVTGGAGPRALRLLMAAAAKVVLVASCSLLLNGAGYAVVGVPFASRCHASGGIDCLVAIALAVALLLGAPALHAVVAARSASVAALAQLALEPSVGISEPLLRPIAGALVLRLARLPGAGARRLGSSLDEYPFFLRGALGIALRVSGLARLSRSAAYLQAAGGADPTDAVTRLLRRDLAEAAGSRRSVFPWTIFALNAVLLVASWAALRFVVRP